MAEHPNQSAQVRRLREVFFHSSSQLSKLDELDALREMTKYLSREIHRRTRLSGGLDRIR